MEEIRSDEDGMRAALEQSARGRGFTSPRPSVGCVLVRNGEIIGGGHTQPGDGNPHAEVMALRDAAARAASTRGATAYVTLEPCSHFRTTPPCTNSLIEAEIARVVCGIRDPNPEIDGRGYAQLRAAGVEVVEEFMRDECFRAQDDFLFHIVHKRPLVTLKSAVSLDGKIAMQSGESKWISGAESRRRAHLLRHENDAVLVGIETVLHDDPQLDARLPGTPKQPLRIVLDSRGRIPLSARVLALDESGAARAIIVTTAQMPPDKRAALEKLGARVLACGAEKVDLPRLWPLLYELGICSVLIEGGTRVAGASLQSGGVGKMIFFVAPIVLGENARAAVAGFDAENLGSAPRLHRVKIETCGGDAMISGYSDFGF